MFDDSVRVGRELKLAMKSARLSQHAVAAEFGVSQPWISRILNGQFGARTDLAMRLCEAYGIEPYAHNTEDDGQFDDLISKLRELWDGTPTGAQRIHALLNAVIEMNRSAVDQGENYLAPKPADGPS